MRNNRQALFFLFSILHEAPALPLATVPVPLHTWCTQVCTQHTAAFGYEKNTF